MVSSSLLGYEVSRTHGLSVRQRATNLVVIWVSSTGVRAVMHEAGVRLAWHPWREQDAAPVLCTWAPLAATSSHC